MPVFAADVLPDATGRNLGNNWQRWNLYGQNLDVEGSINWQPMPGANMGASGVFYVATSPVTANANSTAPQQLAVCDIAAGLLNAQGKVLRATMGGTYTVQAGQTPSLAIAANFGALAVFGVATQALNASVIDYSWRAEFTFTVYLPGTAGQINPHGSFVYRPPTAAGYSALADISILPAQNPIDLTVAQTLVCYCVFSTNTSPANICVQREFIVEVLN